MGDAHCLSSQKGGLHPLSRSPSLRKQLRRLRSPALLAARAPWGCSDPWGFGRCHTRLRPRWVRAAARWHLPLSRSGGGGWGGGLGSPLSLSLSQRFLPPRRCGFATGERVPRREPLLQNRSPSVASPKLVLFEFCCAVVSFLQSSKYINRSFEGNSHMLSRYEGWMIVC